MSLTKDFYNRRISELTALLKKSGSNTSKDLIQEAIKLTHESFVECEKTTKHAENRIAFYDNKKEIFDKGLEQMKAGILQIEAAAVQDVFSQGTKDKIIAAKNAMMQDVQLQYDKQVNANRQLRAAIDVVSADLQSTLLKLIYKPNAASFMLDAVVAVFTKVVTGLLPYSDEAEMILEGGVMRRKKRYLSDGDKILSYLEDYIAVTNAWILLNQQFEQEVLSD